MCSVYVLLFYFVLFFLEIELEKGRLNNGLQVEMNGCTAKLMSSSAVWSASHSAQDTTRSIFSIQSNAALSRVL